MAAHKQTVGLAIDMLTGELVEAPHLLKMSEADFTAMRRRAMQARIAGRNGRGTVAPYVCAACRHPVWLSRHLKADGNRWFAHESGAPAECPYYEGRRLSPEIHRALLYRGQQESQQHERMKNFIAAALRADPLANYVRTEKVTFSEVAAGEWRRPDVSCIWNGHHVVFEIQLTYTFLSVVLEREAFYLREGVNIIWVFQQFDRSRAVVADEAFFNRRNLFVLDNEAARATQDSGVLAFSGWHQVPHARNGGVGDIWTHRFVGLRDLVFPQKTFRPYFYDYDAERGKIVSQARWQAELRSWRELTQLYLAVAEAAFIDDEGSGAHVGEQLEPIVLRMQNHACWHRGLEPLGEWWFRDHVLRRLLSIKKGRPIGFRVNSVFQVIESGLRNSMRDLPHAYAIMLLWAYKLWKPPVSDKNRKWLVEYGAEVRRSIVAGELTYKRFLGADEAAGSLFPDLNELLCQPWGTDRFTPEA